MGHLTVLQGVRTVQLTKGQVTLVDEDDYPCVVARNWYASPSVRGKYYAHTGKWNSEKRRTIALSMQRFLMCPSLGMEVDHRDGDSLNNCRSNLRVCTSSENKRNRRRTMGLSKYKGVMKNSRPGRPIRWGAMIGVSRGVKFHLGTFATEEEAARAYDAKAIELFGEFAATNADIYGAY